MLEALRDPHPLDEVTGGLSDLFGGDTGRADALLLDWGEAGLLTLEPDPAGGSFATGLPLPCGDLALGVMPGEADWFEAYRHLPAARVAADRAFAAAAGDLGFVQVADASCRIVSRHLLAAAFRFGIMEHALGACSDIALHCATLVLDGEAILLLGQPGAGKSTLAWAASEKGLRLACDDIAFLAPQERTIMPLALPLTLKRGSWDRPPARAATPVMRQDGVEVTYSPLPGPPVTAPLPIRALIVLGRQDGGETRLERWPATDCLRHLCSEARSRTGTASAEDIDGLVALASGADTARLVYHEAAEAAELLVRHLAR